MDRKDVDSMKHDSNGFATDDYTQKIPDFDDDRLFLERRGGSGGPPILPPHLLQVQLLF